LYNIAVYEPGTVLAGKYRIDRVIGRGGMGVVLAVVHTELRTQLAVKVLIPKYADRPKVVERFVREARAAARLRSDHSCRVSDAGRLDDGTPYIAMELLEGRDLRMILREDGPLSLAIAIECVRQACDAVGEAHAAGIVHRDLKPSNLFLTEHRDGSPLLKVLDFGVAKAYDEDASALTGTHAVIGSPSYMAPEQVRSAKDVDARSDIWSLGVILCELVGDDVPFHGDTTLELSRNIQESTPVLPADAPRELVSIIERCLHKDPMLRYQSAGELAAALAAFAKPGDVSTDVVPPATRRRTFQIAIALGAVVAIALGVWAARVVSHHDEPSPPIAAPAPPAPAPPPQVPVAPRQAPEPEPAPPAAEVTPAPKPHPPKPPRKKIDESHEDLGASRL
jgi:serine/threonine protein kinase